MGVMVNGRVLGVQSNGLFDESNTVAIPGGRLWPEAGLTWNAMRTSYIAGGGAASEFMPAGPNSSARTRAAQDHFWTHQPPPAARPYTSNHGWGIAVDVVSQKAAAWIVNNGARYGWSHDEGQRVGEWWHMRYVGLSQRELDKLKELVDPFRSLRPDERKWATELTQLRHEHRDVERRKALVAVLVKRRKHIWRTAQKAGWDRARRRERWDALKALTT
jgi:hypothetical protein